MKILASTIISCLCLVHVGLSQPCHQITIDDPKEKLLLSEYINECVRDHHFIDDKGVVVITRFINEMGRPTWDIRAVIDDAYKDNPPTEWATFGQDIILFYDARSRFELPKTTATPELLKCLDVAVGDRLYVRPPKQDRWVETTDPNGKGRRVRNMGRVTGGGAHNSKVITFEADGKVKILKSV
jgi:hypothetical protein